MRRLALAALLLAAAPRDAAAQRLFRSAEPLDVTIAADLRAFARERDSTRLRAFPATFTAADSAGAPRVIPVSIRARGHYRRQARNCDFPPVRLDVARNDAQGTVLQGNRRFKLVTTCRPDSREYEQYILAEYGAYRAWQLVHPLHYRTRLLRLTWRDTTGARKPFTTWGFLLEDDEEVAKEHGLGVEAAEGALFADLDTLTMARTSLFQWAIGNTDWSVSGRHNITLFRDSTMRTFAIPYDFDFSGAVGARYATPDPRLRIRTVAERLHRGPCLTLARWTPIVADFRARARAIDSAYAAVPGLDAGYRQRIARYWGEAFAQLADERGIRRHLVDECQPQGN